MMERKNIFLLIMLLIAFVFGVMVYMPSFILENISFLPLEIRNFFARGRDTFVTGMGCVILQISAIVLVLCPIFLLVGVLFELFPSFTLFSLCILIFIVEEILFFKEEGTAEAIFDEIKDIILQSNFVTSHLSKLESMSNAVERCGQMVNKPPEGGERIVPTLKFRAGKKEVNLACSDVILFLWFAIFKHPEKILFSLFKADGGGFGYSIYKIWVYFFASSRDYFVHGANFILNQIPGWQWFILHVFFTMLPFVVIFIINRSSVGSCNWAEERSVYYFCRLSEILVFILVLGPSFFCLVGKITLIIGHGVPLILLLDFFLYAIVAYFISWIWNKLCFIIYEWLSDE